MSLNKIIRLGKATPEARRVAVTHPALHVGRRDTTWYSGTLNVDVDIDNRKDVLAVLSDTGSYGYRLNTNTYIRKYTGNWNSGTPYYLEPLYQNFLRIYTFRNECDRILLDPSRYWIFINKTQLAISNPDQEFYPGLSRVWRGPWVNMTGVSSALSVDGIPLDTSLGTGNISDTYVVTLASVSTQSNAKGWGSTGFTISVRSTNQDALLNQVALHIYDSLTKQFTVRALINFTPSYGLVEFVTGVVPMSDFNFLTYVGKRTQALTDGSIRAKRVGSKYISIFLSSLQ